MEMSVYQFNENAKLTAYIPDHEIGYKLYKDRPGIVIAPGGAYLMHATREKEGVALEFLKRGYNAYVLEYSVGFNTREEKESGLRHITSSYRYPQPVLEMLESIHYIRSHKEMFHQTDDLYLLGFSAGGHLCASTGIFYDDETIINQLSFKPAGNELRASGMILCYPMLSGNPDKLVPKDKDNIDKKLMSEFLYDTDTPTQQQIESCELVKQIKDTTIPAFIWHSIDDDIVDSQDSTKFILELQKRHINCEYHLFDHGGHGLALCNDIYARIESDIHPELGIWVDLACNWMQKIGV